MSRAVTLLWAELILQPFRHFTYVTTHSPTFPSLYELCSFSNLSVASPMSQLILKPFFRISYVTSSSLNSPGEPSRAHSPTFSTLQPTSQLILQPFRRYTYVTVHSPTLPFLHLRHRPFSNPSFASPTSQVLRLIHLANRAEIILQPFWTLQPTSQLILQLFQRYTYVTVHSPTLPLLHLRHS